jgi:3-oxoacyl-[acyl-carrier protein] reductase
MMSVESSLAGRIALVTGASRKIGIGAAICRLFARAGADIFFTFYTPYDHDQPWGNQPAEPAELLQELRALGIRAESVEADLSDPHTPAYLFQQAETALGPVDILVNNATYDVETDIYALTAEVLDRHYEVNVRGTAMLCAEFAHRHDGRTGGRIINMVSGELVSPMTDNLPYVMTKGAIDALTITLSGSLASKGITVNAIDPGPTDTGWIPPDLHARLVENSFFGRVGLPEDTANLALFLASSQGQWLTGQIIHSRGGF